MRLWDVNTGRALATLRDVGNILAVAFSPDGSLLASTNEDGDIKLWDPARGELVRTIRGEADQLRCLAFTPDGRNVVAAGKGKVIRIWDVATGQELLALEGHKAQINALAFAPDGSTLASCSHDGAVRLWRPGRSGPCPGRDRDPLDRFPRPLREKSPGTASDPEANPVKAEFSTAGLLSSTLTALSGNCRTPCSSAFEINGDVGEQPTLLGQHLLTEKKRSWRQSDAESDFFLALRAMTGFDDDE